MMNNKKLHAIYSLKWNPFSSEIPTDAVWASPRFDLFCSRLQHQVRDGGFALISGDPGGGKSISLRLAAHRLGELPDVTVGVISRPQSHLADFYRELGYGPRPGCAPSSAFPSLPTIAGWGPDPSVRSGWPILTRPCTGPCF